MPTTETIAFALTAIVVLGIVAKWIAWRLHLPAILILLLTGFAVGPGLRWAAGDDLLFLDPERLFGSVLLPVVSLSVAIVLYEGGLTLQFREIRDVGHVIRNLVTVGALAAWAATSALAHALLGFSWGVAILLGAILVVTGPTVIGPLLQQVRPQGAVGSILKWEGIVIDPIGATLAVLVFDAVHAGQGPHRIVGSLLLTAAAGGLLGLLGARLLVACLARHLIPDHLDNAASLAVLVTVFTLANHIHDESGLIAATVMGIALANQRTVSIQHLVEFKENLRVLLISALFVVLAAMLRQEHLRVALEPGAVVFIAALILVVRPVSVLISTFGSRLATNERVFLACVAPRGIVAAAVSSVFALRLAAAEGIPAGEAERLVAVTFLVIIATVATYGLLAGPIAERLALSQRNPQGLLLLGAHPGVRDMARALAEEGHRVLLVDSNRNNVEEAQALGLESLHANVLSEFVSDELDLGGIGRLLAMTPNDEVNALACQRFSEVFGRREVYRLAPRSHGDARHDTSFHHLGRILFGPGETNQKLYDRRTQGARLERVVVGSQREVEELRAREDEVLPLFIRRPNKELVPLTDGPLPPVPPGSVALCLALAPLQPSEPGESGEPADIEPEGGPERVESPGEGVLGA